MNCDLLTGRTVVWSPRCPQFSLQVGVGVVEEEEMVGLLLPQGGPPPLEALLLECLKIPAGGEQKEI